MLVLAGCNHAGDDQHGASATPDFSGTWERYPEDWYGANPDRPVLPGGAFDLKQPYAARYAAIRDREDAADAAGTPLVNASSKCIPEGMPTLMGAIYPIQIVQTKDQFIVLTEFLSQIRRVQLGEKMPAAEEISPSYNGQSVGHWEGQALVIETRGVRPDVTFYSLPHSDKMVIRERIHRSAPDRIVNEVTIEDPETLNKPYRFAFEYKKSNYRIQEYICDNNQLKVDADGGTVLDVQAISK